MLFTQLLTAAVLAVTGIATPIGPSNGKNTTYIGPENGHLVIVGGNLKSDRIWERIITLAGGPNSSIVVVPTAGGDPTYNSSFPAALSLQRLGAKVTVLHTYDPAVADTDEFIAGPSQPQLASSSAGGRQWRLVDAYAGTKSRIRISIRSSAGASIIGSFLARGDTRNNTIMIGDHTVGFGYLKNAAIDQHVLVRNRHFDMFEILNANPELWGVAIDEDTALIVRQNEAEVFGNTYALVYDGGFWSREGTSFNNVPPPNARFYFLKEGDKYDLVKREVIVPAAKRDVDEEW
ncbi:hypothetical protein SNOG_15141 [Parastagonospora nodorum SN15]|uniref:Uncharacterized protein n=1 Tax=Phaeosphaeria nodorum (strain SN15 / ATCC MYA-4574 / FGSC 10173) TaxID=321614 RepID=Q0TZ15_PHANO|nr:hypothetical protein SNOG_15141 [Parastagonospora nodorum SN15]EAT77366.2 hypothetical protein SNOG_15141 [Parastagonospora nodorum SN15]